MLCSNWMGVFFPPSSYTKLLLESVATVRLDFFFSFNIWIADFLCRMKGKNLLTSSSFCFNLIKLITKYFCSEIQSQITFFHYPSRFKVYLKKYPKHPQLPLLPRHIPLPLPLLHPGIVDTPIPDHSCWIQLL